VAQLVGRDCVLCGAPISSSLDARFCTACGSPVHAECSLRILASPPDGCCAACGAPRAVLEARVLEKQERAESARSQAALTSVVLGVACILGGTLATVGCSCLTLGAGSGRFVIATGAIAVGIGFIVRGLRQLPHR